MKREEMLDKVQRGLVYVEFKKKSGEWRKMYGTRNDRVILETGHNPIDFNQNDIRRMEGKHPHLVHVFDVQENDTRIINMKMMDEGTVKEYKSIKEANPPRIKTRFEKKEESKNKEKEEVGEKLDQGVSDVRMEDIFN